MTTAGAALVAVRNPNGKTISGAPLTTAPHSKP